ncbi:MAG: GH39 family glycosyl hydrolase [Actinomycetes bacterium]
MQSIRRGVLVVLVAPLLASCQLLPGDDEGAPPAPPVPAVVVAPAPPIGAIDADFFGMHDHDPLSWPHASIGSLRVWDAGVTWRDVEVSPGVYNFDRLDAIVDAAEENDAEALIVLGQTPPFHAERPEAESFYGPGASSPPTMESWTAYVRAVASRYEGRPVFFQVWNEANIKGFWRGTPAEMAALTKAAYDVLATMTPRPTLVAPAFVTRLIGQRAWFDSFYGEKVDGAPVADLVDVVSLQLYPDSSGTPETAMQLLEAAKVTLDRHEVNKPIWNTEVNYGLTGIDVEPAPVEAQQAKVARTMLLNAANDVDRVYWYGWDQQGNVDTLLTEPDGSALTPAGTAYLTVQDWLVGSVVESCDIDSVGTYTCTLRRSDSVRRVYWNPSGNSQLNLPPSATVYQRLDGDQTRATKGHSQDVGTLPLMVESSK